MFDGIYRDMKDLTTRGLAEVTPHIRFNSGRWYSVNYGYYGNPQFARAAETWCGAKNAQIERERVERIRGRIWERPGAVVEIPAPPRRSILERIFG